MNYVSGLMLGASLANILRQTLGGGSGSASFAHGMSGGRGRFMQGNMFSSDPSGLAGGASALAGLFGGGQRGCRRPQSRPLSVCTHHAGGGAIGHPI